MFMRFPEELSIVDGLIPVIVRTAGGVGVGDGDGLACGELVEAGEGLGSGVGLGFGEGRGVDFGGAIFWAGEGDGFGEGEGGLISTTCANCASPSQVSLCEIWVGEGAMTISCTDFFENAKSMMPLAKADPTIAPRNPATNDSLLNIIRMF